MRTPPIGDEHFKHDAPPAARKKLITVLVITAVGGHEDLLTASDYADCSMIASGYLRTGKFREETVALMHKARERAVVQVKVKSSLAVLRRFDLGLDTDKAPVRDALDYLETITQGMGVMQGDHGVNYTSLLLRLRMMVGRGDKEKSDAR